MQVSDQCVKLVKAGWFDQQQEPSGVSTLTDPKVSKRNASKADRLLLGSALSRASSLCSFSVCAVMHAPSR